MMRSFVGADLCAEYGGRFVSLNPALIKRQGISQSAVISLRSTHVEKLRLFSQMDSAATHAELLDLARKVDGMEYRQQALWRFPLDPLFHAWFEVPRCSCHKAIGKALYGRSPLRVIHTQCPVHAQLLHASMMSENSSRQKLLDAFLPVREISFQAGSYDPVRPWSDCLDTHVVIDTNDPVHGAALLQFTAPSDYI